MVANSGSSGKKGRKTAGRLELLAAVQLSSLALLGIPLDEFHRGAKCRMPDCARLAVRLVGTGKGGRNNDSNGWPLCLSHSMVYYHGEYEAGTVTGKARRYGKERVYLWEVGEEKTERWPTEKLDRLPASRDLAQCLIEPESASVLRYMERLSWREREIIDLRYRDNPSTYNEIGRIFEIGRERARQIEMNALRKLRDYIVREQHMREIEKGQALRTRRI